MYFPATAIEERFDRRRNEHEIGRFRGRSDVVERGRWVMPCGSAPAVAQALATGNNIVDRKNSKFLAMSPAMTNTLLRFVPENNQLFAAALLCGSCQHGSIVHVGSAYQSVVGI